MSTADDTSGTQPLSEREYRKEAQGAFDAIFRSTDPFDEPLQPHVARKGLLYPFGMMLEPDELDAVARAAREAGDSGFFLSVTERPPEDAQPEYPYDWHWWIPLADLDAYYHLRFPSVLENALYSRNGTWGILCSHEGNAVIGGLPAFVNPLYLGLSAPEDEQVRRFADDWRSANERWGARVDWVPRVLIHLYGQHGAQTVLREVGFPSDPRAWIGRYPRPGDPP